MTQTITALECRFAVHIPTRNYDVPDIHLIKEQVHYSDGSVKPNVKLLANFKRPFWITQKSKQNHEQKKNGKRKIIC